MGHTDYTQSFDSVAVQRNVMAFVGNGFDIQALHDYGARVDTRYEHFYDFLARRHFDPSNIIMQEMRELKDAGAADWSDVEGAVSRLLDGPKVARAEELIEALRQLQGQFSEFLDAVVPSSILTELGADSARHKWAMESLLMFLYDLSPEQYRVSAFPTGENLELYNFLFVNFNYTPLLDDFIHLDQIQFDRLSRRTVDRNCDFHNNPRGVEPHEIKPKDLSSSYLMADVIHPHGQQSVPRSLLFGIDEPVDWRGNQDPRLRLAKPFWAQNRARYAHLFEDTALFIIFGCSLGGVDRWWWDAIAASLGQQRDRHKVVREECRALSHESCTYTPELIIYWYNGGSTPLTEEEVRAKFFEGAGCLDDSKALIHVILYDDRTERVWLRTTAQRPTALAPVS